MPRRSTTVIDGGSDRPIPPPTAVSLAIAETFLLRAGSRCAEAEVTTQPVPKKDLPDRRALRHDRGMTRTADLGIRIGVLPSGPTGSVVDVPGVGVGHATVWRDEPPPPAGRGVARTGVTVLDLGGNLFRSPVPTGGAVLNGAGECTGFLAAAEWGLAETPVFLTSTMQVGRVYDAACALLMAEDPGIADDVIIPVVAECDDSFLSDVRRMQVTAADVRTAREGARASAGGPAPAEGAVGSGTGMSCLGFKGGIGTASRVVPAGPTVGVLVMTNFGDRERLTVDGVPVGRRLPPGAEQAAGLGQTAAPGQTAAGQAAGFPGGGPARPAGSCIVIVVTDAPLEPASCARLARRAGLGLARTGSTAHHGSGEIFLAMATGLRAPRGGPPARVTPVAGSGLDPLFDGVVEATEEAVLNSMLAAPTVTGRDGHTSYGLPADEVRRLLQAAGRI
jgi:D-aminopeptidase